MDIRRKITQGKSLTPTEQQLGISALAMGEDIRGLSIKEFAARTNVSVASVHRFAKSSASRALRTSRSSSSAWQPRRETGETWTSTFPSMPPPPPAQVMERMEGLYQTTLAETQELLDPAQLDYAAKLVMRADTVDIYTGSHNLYPAGMFRDRLLSAGKSATCYGSVEAQVRTALASGPDHAAIVISYSGLAPNLKDILPILSSRHVPVIVIGTPYCARIHPGFAAYLTVSDHESMTHRITQFASHIAVQYVLDSLYSSYLCQRLTPAVPSSSSGRSLHRLPAQVTTSVDFWTLR